jgi:uncharacterized membrane protein YciS (DUF1049 family)
MVVVVVVVFVVVVVVVAVAVAVAADLDKLIVKWSFFFRCVEYYHISTVMILIAFKLHSKIFIISIIKHPRQIFTV